MLYNTTRVVVEVVLHILVHKPVSNGIYLIFDGGNMDNICTSKPYINTRATPPNAPREVQFVFLETTGYDSRGGLA